MLMELTLTHEGAEALREFASALPLSVDNIIVATDTLFNIYNAVADRLGEHSQDFSNLLIHIKKAQSMAADAILDLPPKMKSTADKIDAYVASRPNID